MRAKKDNFELFHVFFIELFLKDVLGLLACEGTTFKLTFQVKARVFWYVRGDFHFMNFTTFCYLIS